MLFYIILEPTQQLAVTSAEIASLLHEVTTQARLATQLSTLQQHTDSQTQMVG